MCWIEPCSRSINLKSFTIIDQFQPAALRYQINHMGFALGMAQGMYTPNFHGYLSPGAAQPH